MIFLLKHSAILKVFDKNEGSFVFLDKLCDNIILTKIHQTRLPINEWESRNSDAYVNEKLQNQQIFSDAKE
ncbi:hypothetical protein A9G25_05890 [Gilliamella sp. Bif1-4]|jgi:hypothetical protein|nr:hypothetical protein A9G25_05890 [Gilliamella apicola]